MIFGRKKKNKAAAEQQPEPEPQSTPADTALPPQSVAEQEIGSMAHLAPAATTPDAKPEAVEDAPGGLFARLGRTRNLLGGGLNRLLGSGTKIDESLFADLEDELLSADVGVDAALEIVEQVRKRAKTEKVEHAPDLKKLVRDVMLGILRKPLENSTTVTAQAGKPHVLLMVGVNGVGKTTSVAKLAARAKNDGQSVVVAAADTFRAAAIEQLQSWGQRLDIPVISQAHGSDAAAVAHDAVTAATARQADLLIVDTAGRQHTHNDLMEQLAKVVRVMRKVDAEAPHETYIVVDAGNGQNILSQIEQFSNVVPITGVVISKLDGTAKGGVLLAVAGKLDLPVKFIGVGEAVGDLRQFDPEEFVQALLPD